MSFDPKEWALNQVREVKQAKAAIVVLLVVGFMGGWAVARFVYAERIEVLLVQLDAAVAGRPVAAKPPNPVIVTTQWPGRTLWLVTGVTALACVLLIVSARRKSTENKSLIKRTDTLQNDLRDSNEQRDQAHAWVKNTKREHALEVLERYSHFRPREGAPPTKVTIRYASYGDDYELAQKIQELFTNYVRWPVTLELATKASAQNYLVLARLTVI